MDFDIFIAGDFYVGNHANGRLLPLVEENRVDDLFGELLPVLKNSKLSIINLEAPIIDQDLAQIKTGPSLKMPNKIGNILSDAGIDLVCLANNHILDHGAIGLKNTLQILKDNSIAVVGAGMNEKEKTAYSIKTIRDKKIGIVNVCENEWISDKDGKVGANGLDEVDIFYQIKNLKSLTDFIIVIFHGGNEYYPLPSPRIKKTMRFFIDLGADAVVGHHTHTYSGNEIFKEKPIYYSLGNFIFDSQKKSKGKNWNIGIGLGITIENNKLIPQMVPFKQHAEKIGVNVLRNEELISFNKEIEELNFIIQDEKLLKAAYGKFANQLSIQYQSFINPYEGKLSSLFKKGLLPNIFSKNKNKLLLNLIRCESHRDVLEIILNNKLKNK